jgi:hypothetical protein
MKCATAQTPGPESSQDRVFVTTRIVIVLDGASAFIPVDVPTATYVDSLGSHMVGSLTADPLGSLPEIVFHSIESTAREFNLQPGGSPSSTVTILRAAEHQIDLYALGDGAVYYGNDRQISEMTDSRLSDLGLPEPREYRKRLAEGYGYDDHHRGLLSALQRGQRERRNRAGGYWIAEADPATAHHAIVRSVPPSEISWAVLATDGAYGPMRHLGLDDWRTVAEYSDDQLAALLDECARWEAEIDPNGQLLPRAKISDDKTLAAVSFV